MAQIAHNLQSERPASAYVLGVRVDRLTQQQVLAYIESFASDPQLVCRQIITVNSEFVMAAQRDTRFRRCINEAALVVADGMGVVWATRYLGQPTPERVTGVDTVVEVAKRCAKQGY